MDDRSDSIALAERQVAEAQAAVLAELEAVRAKLSRRASSPLFIGGVLLGAVALGYFAFGRGQPTRSAHAGRPGAWSRAAGTARMLLPLLVALNAAIGAVRKPGAGVRSRTR